MKFRDHISVPGLDSRSGSGNPRPLRVCSSFFPGCRVQSGFTLIEMLTVIAIIGIIAGLLVGLAPAATRSMRMKRIQGELQQLITAIESYKAKFGHYPPDNIVNRRPLLVNDSTNQLYYELTGWVYSGSDGTAQPLERGGVFHSATARKYFNTPSFVNASTNESEVRNFLPSVKGDQVVKLPLNSANPDVALLKVAVPRAGVQVNTWHYRTTDPTNNPGRFDLWAEISVGNEVRVISNWK